MALGPIVSFTSDELDLIEKLEAKIDSAIEYGYNGGEEFSIPIQKVSPKIEYELSRLYRDAGWNVAFFGFGSFKLAKGT